MGFIPNILSPVSNIIDRIIPDRYLIRVQETLIRAGMYVKASDLITLSLIAGIILGIITYLIAITFQIYPILLGFLGFFTPAILIGAWLFIKMERRVDTIEQTTPDFLRQTASLLRAGIGLETALEDVSKHGKGPLNEELKRAVIEIKIGRSFEEAILMMGERLRSQNLDRTFRMILEGRRAGGSLANVIDTVAEDLRAVLALKRERRANVMMSVMFLIIAAIIAAPFALGMIMTYGSFIEAMGKSNPLLNTASTAATGYIIIHSFMAGLLIGVVMYGSARKGIKFAIPLVILAFIIFYVIKTFAIGLIGTGF
jgi:archaeal flagellar protein FlaJ